MEWAVDFGINRAGVTLQWSFAFAAYSDFTADLPSLDAGPTQTATAAAGTPGNKQYNTKLLQVGLGSGSGSASAQILTWEFALFSKQSQQSRAQVPGMACMA